MTKLMGYGRRTSMNDHQLMTEDKRHLEFARDLGISFSLNTPAFVKLVAYTKHSTWSKPQEY